MFISVKLLEKGVPNRFSRRTRQVLNSMYQVRRMKSWASEPGPRKRLRTKTDR